MKTARILLIMLVAIVTQTLSAQTHYVPHVWVGAHAGMSMSEAAFSPSLRQKMLSGFTAGVSVRFAEERHVGILAELNIAQRGWAEDFEDAPYRYTRTLTYISLPVMTHIFFGSKRLKCIINLGPEFGYLIGDNRSANFDYANVTDIPGFPLSNRSTEQMAMKIRNKFDYGITAGIGAEWSLNPAHSFYIEGRYYFGLGNIYPSAKKDVFAASRLTSIEVTLGWMFRLK